MTRGTVVLVARVKFGGSGALVLWRGVLFFLPLNWSELKWLKSRSCVGQPNLSK